MQSEIINEIIEVEDQATDIVEQARDKASDIINKADIQGKKIVKDTIKAERLKNQKKINQILIDNKKEVNDFETGLRNTVCSDLKNLDSLAINIADKICNSSVFKS